MVRLGRKFSIFVLSLLTVALFSAVAHADAAAKKPAKQCSDVTSLQIDNVLIFSAKPVPEGASMGSAGPMMPPIPPQPAHCVVEGEVNKHTGSMEMSTATSSSYACPTHGTAAFCSKVGEDSMEFLIPLSEWRAPDSKRR